jgi:putative SOS response-associated peptidase YedK
MCGRYATGRDPADLVEEFGVDRFVLDERHAPDFQLPANYNVAPTDEVYAVVERLDKTNPKAPPQRQLRVVRWGLVPSWAKDRKVASKFINARAETLAEKPAFRKAFAGRRCLLPADGYYEWQGAGKGKVPYYFRLADGRAFGLAGLWDRWDRGDAPLETCTVITTVAGTRTSSYHHRMPVVLTEEAATAWLNPSASPAELASLMVAYGSGDLEMYEVSRFVNDPANDSEECIRRVDNDVATFGGR